MRRFGRRPVSICIAAWVTFITLSREKGLHEDGKGLPKEASKVPEMTLSKGNCTVALKVIVPP